MDRNQKKQFVADIQETLNDTNYVLVTKYKGLNVAQMSQLRKEAREVDATYRVTQNRLTKIALKGTKFENLTDSLTGPVALVFAKEPVAASKVMAEFAKKEEKLELVAASMDEQLFDVNAIKTLASLPTMDELRGKLVGLIQAPAQKIVGVTQAPAGQVARVLSAYASK